MSVGKRKSVITMAMNRCNVPQDLLEIVLTNFDMAVKEANEHGKQELKTSIINKLQNLCQEVSQ